MTELFRELFLNPEGIFLPPILSFTWTSILLISLVIGTLSFAKKKISQFAFSMTTLVPLSYASTDFLVSFFWEELVGEKPSSVMYYYGNISVEALTIFTVWGLSLYFSAKEKGHSIVNPLLLKITALLTLNGLANGLIILYLMKLINGVSYLMIYSLGVNAVDILLCWILIKAALPQKDCGMPFDNRQVIKDVMR